MYEKLFPGAKTKLLDDGRRALWYKTNSNVIQLKFFQIKEGSGDK